MNASVVLALLLASQVSSVNDSAPVGAQPSNTQAVEAQLNSLNAQVNKLAAECMAAAEALRKLKDNEPQRPARQDAITTTEFEKEMQGWNQRVKTQAARVQACNAKLDKLQAQAEKLSKPIPSSGRQ